jgi:transglutaminase-like putative cysteine protease
MSDLAPFLEPNDFVDADHPLVAAYAAEQTAGAATAVERIVRLYYAIRDGFRYNPWRVRPERAAFKASDVLQRSRDEGAHCIDKANLLAAASRALGIPSRLHFAIVRNHIGTAELERLLGTDLLVFHGYAELRLGGHWVAATPAFNKELCDHLGVAPLEFDGVNDSVFQPYDRKGGRFMEYVHDYGAFPDVPFELMIAEWKKHYGEFAAARAWPARPNGRDGGSTAASG